MVIPRDCLGESAFQSANQTSLSASDEKVYVCDLGDLCDLGVLIARRGILVIPRDCLGESAFQSANQTSLSASDEKVYVCDLGDLCDLGVQYRSLTIVGWFDIK